MTPNEEYDGRVVVGYDGSPASETAVEWAVAEADLRGRGLTIVHALQPTATAAALGAGIGPGPEFLDVLEAQAHDQLAALAERLRPRDVKTGVAIGGASGVLLDASDTAELLVVGSRGRGGFANLILGSVAAQVASHSSCPVVIARSPSPPGATEIVVGIDASPGAIAAVAFAFDEASRHGWSVVAVHAWDQPSYDLLVIPAGPIPVPLADVADEEVRLSAVVLAGFREDYPDVTVQERLIHGPAVGSLLDAANGAAMIVVGTRGHGPAISALIGSVSNGVLHKARIPVVVVPRTEPRSEAA